MSAVKKILRFISVNRRHMATVAFALGFAVDIITFRTINLTMSEILLAGYLVIVAGSILVLGVPQRGQPAGIAKHLREWLPIVHQYASGNLLSGFLVLYFSSGSLSASWPFLLLVALAALGNEMLSLERYRVPFETTLFFLNILLFSALATPIALGFLDTNAFLLSIAISFGVFVLFFLVGVLIASHEFRTHARFIGVGALSMAMLVFTLYSTHVIPPIPLSAKSFDIYHGVVRAGDTYRVTDEARSWYERFFDIGGVVLHLSSGEPAYVFTSVFAPAHFGADITHTWEWFDVSTHTWVEKETVRFPILGGRSEGYRGYSIAENPTPGRWRISIKTDDGAVIGRESLIVVRTAAPVPTTEKVIQ